MSGPGLGVSLDESGGGQVGEYLDQDVLRGTDPRDLMQRLTQEITRRSIAAQASNLVMLHGAAVTNLETGASLVFVAPGRTGKTTLARRLGSRWGYVTDETVGIREDGTIAPYEKPLVHPAFSPIRAEGRGVARRTWVEASVRHPHAVRHHSDPSPAGSNHPIRDRDGRR